MMSVSDVDWSNPWNWFYFSFYTAIAISLFKNNLVDFNGPLASFFGVWTPTCRASHILVPTEGQAQELLAKLQEGPSAPTLEDFAALAKANSTCNSAKRKGKRG